MKPLRFYCYIIKGSSLHQFNCCILCRQYDWIYRYFRFNPAGIFKARLLLRPDRWILLSLPLSITLEYRKTHILLLWISCNKGLLFLLQKQILGGESYPLQFLLINLQRFDILKHIFRRQFKWRNIISSQKKTS